MLTISFTYTPLESPKYVTIHVTDVPFFISNTLWVLFRGEHIHPRKKEPKNRGKLPPSKKNKKQKNRLIVLRQDGKTILSLKDLCSFGQEIHLRVAGDDFSSWKNPNKPR